MKIVIKKPEEETVTIIDRDSWRIKISDHEIKRFRFKVSLKKMYNRQLYKYLHTHTCKYYKINKIFVSERK